MPASRRNFGTAHGAYGIIFDIGDAAGPIGAGLLIGRLGYSLSPRILALPIPVLVTLLLAASRSPYGRDSPILMRRRYMRRRAGLGELRADRLDLGMECARGPLAD